MSTWPTDTMQRHPIYGFGVQAILDEFRKRKIHITVDPGGPWISVDVEPAWGEEATPENAERKFAVWATSQQVYRVGPDGAVEDTPVESIEQLREPPHEPEEAHPNSRLAEALDMPDDWMPDGD
jgi:hypothetical protein